MNVGFTAEELVQWSSGHWVSSAPRRITTVSKDTRTLKKGALYFAIIGENFDGHDFVGKAFERGAAAAVVSRAWKDGPAGRDFGDRSRPVLVVDDTRQALLETAFAYRDKVDPSIVGITGSAGKSTVKEMAAQMISRAMPTASTVGNWNNDIGLPMSLLLMNPSAEAGVFEVATNHPGEIAGLCRILHPDWGVVTNVGPVHIEHFESVEAIAEEKAALVRSLSQSGTAVLNMDCDYYHSVRMGLNCNVVTVSQAGLSDYNYVQMPHSGKVLVKETFSGEEMLFSPVIPGSHNIINALMAVAIARGHDVGWKHIKSALDNYKPLPMRWEVTVMGEVKFINDAYNANPLSMRASITAFENEPVEGDKWLVLAGMRELGRLERTEHVSLGEYVGEGDWSGIVLVGAPGEMIARGIQTTGYDSGRVHVCVNNSEAAEVLEHNVKKGDAVLMKASRGERLEEIVDTVKTRL